MQQPDDLFLLVKSLTKNEKGYFKKLYSAFETTGEKDFLALFDLLDEADAYNEVGLKKGLKRDSKPVNFAVLKNYLTEKILQSLRMYHQQFSTEYDLLAEMQELHLLKSKKLDHLLSRKLNKALKASEASGLKSMQHYLLWFENFTRNTSSLPEHFRPWQKLETELTGNLNHQQERMVVYGLYKEVEQLYRAQIGFNKKSDKRIAEIEAHPLLELKKNLHFGTELIRNYVLSMLAQIRGDATGGYNYLKGNLKIYEKHKEYAANNSTGYMGVLDSLIRMACALGKYADADKYVSALAKIGVQNEFDKDWNLSIRYEYLLTKAVSLQKFNELGKHLNEMDTFYSRHPEITIPPLYARLMIAFYHNGRKEKALDWAHHIISLKDEKRQYDILQVLARCLVMIIYFEEDNFSLLESEVNSARFYFSKHVIESELSSTLGNTLLRIQKQVDKKERRKLFEKLHEDLGKVLNRNKQNGFLQWFDFAAWCRSKT